MAEAGRRLIIAMTLDPTHWRRHDRAFWTQVLVAAAQEAAPHMMAVEGYEIGGDNLTIRMITNRTAKALAKMIDDDELFLRLRSRLVDLGAQPEFIVEEEGA